MIRRGFTLVELAAVVASGAVLASVAQVTPYVSVAQRRAQSLNNLRMIGAANAQYRSHNADYLPIEGVTPGRRPGPTGSISGWCGWSFAGKNNDGWWARAGIYRVFDVEAADRPLNTYLYPGVVFTAPNPPASLPAAAPARLTEQAPINRDPSDRWTHERS